MSDATNVMHVASRQIWKELISRPRSVSASCISSVRISSMSNSSSASTPPLVMQIVVRRDLLDVRPLLLPHPDADHRYRQMDGVWVLSWRRSPMPLLP